MEEEGLEEDQTGSGFSLGKVEEDAVSWRLLLAGRHILAGRREVWGVVGEGLSSSVVWGVSGGQGTGRRGVHVAVP